MIATQIPLLHFMIICYNYVPFLLKYKNKKIVLSRTKKTINNMKVELCNRNFRWVQATRDSARTGTWTLTPYIWGYVASRLISVHLTHVTCMESRQWSLFVFICRTLTMYLNHQKSKVMPKRLEPFFTNYLGQFLPGLYTVLLTTVLLF